MTPVEALKTIKTLVDGSEGMEDLNALRVLLSIKVVCEKGIPSVRPALSIVSENKNEGGAKVCPECNGRGKFGSRACHGCNGTGFQMFVGD